MYGSHSCHNRVFCTFHGMDCGSESMIALIIGVLDSHLSATMYGCVLDSHLSAAVCVI